MRLFFAIELDPKIRTELAKLIEHLQAQPWGKEVRWINPANLHITLRFIGACPNELVTPIVQQVTAAITDIKSFTLASNGVQLFPNTRRPLVISVNFQPCTELIKLAKTIDQIVMSHGFKAENHNYNPHLSLGRVDRRKNLNLGLLPALEKINFHVEHVALINSTITDQHRVYEALQKIKLKS